MNADDSKFKCLALSGALSVEDKGFTYNLALKKQECAGFIFMTSGIRSNFERFGWRDTPI